MFSLTRLLCRQLPSLFILLVFIALSHSSIAPAGDKQDPKSKLTKEQLDKLFKDVQLPKGDPIPDFVEPEWVPPNPDKSVQNKRGTDFGPAISFTVQLDKTTFVRRGLTVRLPREHAVLYDLDTLGVAATWRGGFLDISQTHFEDNKGRLPGRPGSEATHWVVGTPAIADTKGEFTDPRKDGIGRLPPKRAQYRGHFLHGYRVILSYDVLGRNVLEMPGVDEDAPNECFSRTFHIAASKQPIKLLLAQYDELDNLAKSVLNGKKDSSSLIVKTGGDQRIAVALIGWTKGLQLTADTKKIFLTIDASEKPFSFRLVQFQGNDEQVSHAESYVKKQELVADLRNYVRGGPPRWKALPAMSGKLGPSDGPYAVDTLALPSDNPWKSWIRPAAIDFFSDGRLAMSSMNGDVWMCTGIDDSLKELTWRRYATGLYEPLGLKIVDDKLYVLGRDRITRLHDLNLDGEADFYQTFYAGGVTAPGYHAFVFDLQIDSKGNFYFVKSGRKVDKTPGHNALIRVSADGKSEEIVATGFRHPNGMGIGPNDEIVVSDNQGEFIPCSQINLIKKGRYYGYGTLDPDYERPFLCLPMDQDNSSGGQLWAPKNWGPMSGKMLHTSYGSCKLFYVVSQHEKAGVMQATAIPFPHVFDSGVMRGRINPKDGQVYLSGLLGWGTKAKKDGCLQRVRYTGNASNLVENVQLVPGGMRIDFSCTLDPKSARDVNNYKIEQWRYLYSKRYGSPELSVLQPGKKGHDPVEVKSVSLSKDAKSVTLLIPKLAPVDQLHTAVRLTSSGGREITADLFSTIHALPTAK